ncbi:MAG: alpha/beta fold hydrolase [Halococcoides sp.]
MSLKRFLAATAGGLGLAALGNHWLTRSARPLDPPLDGSERIDDWRGFDIATTELGDPDDPDLVCLHGISAAASSHEFADVAAELATDHHVIAPDLLGFGRSDRPRIDYSAALYGDLVASVLADADDPTVVTSSLSAAYAATAAEGVDIEELIAICPTDRTMALSAAGPLVRSPIVGRSIFNLLASRASIRYFYADHGVADPAAIDSLRIDYDWQTAHQPGARWAPAAFLAGSLQPDRSLEELFAGLDAPVRLLWGREADLPPVDRGRELADALDTELVIFEETALLPHVEHPRRFVEVVRGEIGDGTDDDRSEPQD